MDLTRTELLDVGFDALADDSRLPVGLGDRIAAATTAVRPARHPEWANAGGAQAAFLATAVGLRQLLDSLTPDEWTRLTDVAGGVSVRDLVLHLVGVERYLLGQLGRRSRIDAPRPEDHYGALRAAATDLDDADSDTVVRAWWNEVLELVRASAELGPDHDIAYHHLASPIRSLLVVRTFELWTHDDDIRRAVGLPPNQLDHQRLSLMSSALVGALPLGMALAGTTRPGRTVRIDLTGPGGGTSFMTALSPDEVAGVPDLTIETSALDLCRLASNRLPIDRLDAVVDGDRSLLEPVLVGATAFAMD